jgi:nitrite reductase/ring-hydroxylating ferredoxin subunit
MKIEKVYYDKLPYRYLSEVFMDEILIYDVDGVLYAISGFCPHFGGPLEVKQGTIHCFWHDWKFDLHKHKCLNKQVNLRIRSYRIERISSTEILLEDDS